MNYLEVRILTSEGTQRFRVDNREQKLYTIRTTLKKYGACLKTLKKTSLVYC